VSAADRAIRVSTAAAVVAVAGIAAYVSYWHAHDVVRAHGESGVTARLEPFTIGGLVYASSMVVLYAARHRLAVPGLARWLLALGIMATLGANVAHGWHAGPIGAAVAAWPAAAGLVGSYELLLWLVRTAARGPAVREPAADRAGLPANQTEAELRLVPSPRSSDTASGSAPAQRDVQDVDAAAAAAYRLSLDVGQPLSRRKLAAMFGTTSRRWARHRMAEARQAAELTRADSQPAGQRSALSDARTPSRQGRTIRAAGSVR
jgi:hypothetical protein